MLSVACTQDGLELYVGSYANIWSSQDGGARWTQLTWPQPDTTQYSVPGALGGWCVVDLAASLGWRVEKHSPPHHGPPAATGNGAHRRNDADAPARRARP